MLIDTAQPIEISKPQVVSVRSLVEFVLQAGDLAPGSFQKRDRAQPGTQGHRQVQRSRPAGNQETLVGLAVMGGIFGEGIVKGL